MSKNIDEITANTFKQIFINPNCCYGYLAAQVDFKQALTEKKLVVPMSEKEIFKLLESKFYDLSVVDLAKAIYERQFKTQAEVSK